MDHEHKESWRMCMASKPLTAKVKLVHQVVNSVKWNLTAYKPTKMTINFKPTVLTQC